MKKEFKNIGGSMSDIVNKVKRIERYKYQLKKHGVISGGTQMVCPYCFHEQSDTWEMDEGVNEMTCKSCGEEFIYEDYVERIFTTQKK